MPASDEHVPPAAAGHDSRQSAGPAVAWETVGALGLGLFGMGAAIGSYSGYVPLLLERGVAPGRAGFGVTLFLLFLSLSVLPADWSTRLVSIKGATLVGLAVGAAGAVLAGVATLPAALVSRSLLGVGQGAVFVTSMKYAGVTAPPRATARVQGLLGGLFTLGFAAALATTPALLSLLGPRAPSISVVLVLAGGVWTLRLPHARHSDPPALAEYASAFTSATGVALGLANMATFGFLVVATTWYTDLVAGFEVLPLTWTLTGFALMTVVGRIAGGWIEPRAGARTTVGVSLLGLAGALGLLLVAVAAGSPVALAAGVLATGLGFGVPFGPLFSLAFAEQTLAPGTVLVQMMVVGNLGALVYPWLVGELLATTASYLAGFAVMALTVVAIWAVWQTVGPRTVRA